MVESGLKTGYWALTQNTGLKSACQFICVDCMQRIQGPIAGVATAEYVCPHGVDKVLFTPCGKMHSALRHAGQWPCNVLKLHQCTKLAYSCVLLNSCYFSQIS